MTTQKFFFFKIRFCFKESVQFPVVASKFTVSDPFRSVKIMIQEKSETFQLKYVHDNLKHLITFTHLFINACKKYYD